MPPFINPNRISDEEILRSLQAQQLQEEVEEEEEQEAGSLISITTTEDYQDFVESGRVVTRNDNIDFFDDVIAIESDRSSDGSAEPTIILGPFIALIQTSNAGSLRDYKNIRTDLANILKDITFEDRVLLEIWTRMDLDELDLIHKTKLLLEALNDRSFHGQKKGGTLVFNDSMKDPHNFIRALWSARDDPNQYPEYPNIIGLKVDRILEYFGDDDFWIITRMFPNLKWFQFHKNNIHIDEPTFGERFSISEVAAKFEGMNTVITPFSGAFNGIAIPRIVASGEVEPEDYFFNPYDEFEY